MKYEFLIVFVVYVTISKIMIKSRNDRSCFFYTQKKELITFVRKLGCTKPAKRINHVE